MRRKKRGCVEWHVTLRGARRLFVFRDDQDYLVYLRYLKEALELTDVESIAYCLMSNHVHLVLRGDSSQLAKCMRRVNRAYSGYHNKRYNLSGHAFEQSYFCCPLPNIFYLSRVVRYVHLNPTRAGIPGKPENYPWSNCATYFYGAPDTLRSNVAPFLARFGETPPAAREAYRAFVEADLLRPRKAAPDAVTASELWQEQFRWILDSMNEQRAAIAPLTPARAAMWLAVRSGIPPRAIAKALGLRDGHSVSNRVQYLNGWLADRPGVEAILGASAILGEAKAESVPDRLTGT